MEHDFIDEKEIEDRGYKPCPGCGQLADGACCSSPDDDDDDDSDRCPDCGAGFEEDHDPNCSYDDEEQDEP